MDTRVFSSTIQFGVAFLLLIPSIGARADVLREEAVSYRIKGYELQRQGDYAGASLWYRKATAIDPSYPTPHNDMGVVLEQQGKLEEAKGEYQKALAINPTYLKAHGNLAILYERMGDDEKAIYHWLKRYQLGDPSDPWTTRAEERLVALGVIKAYSGAAGTRFARRRITEEAFELHSKSLEEFNAITEQHGDWP